MATENNKHCLVCGKAYTYCHSCAQYSHLPKWMDAYHSENCKKIFEAIGPWVNRQDKEESKKRLSNCDLSVKETLKPLVQKRIEEILGVELNEESKELVESLIDVEVDEKEIEKIQLPPEIIPTSYLDNRKNRRKK